MSDIILKVSNQNAKSIIDSCTLNKEDTYERVIQLMKNCERIDFYGIGPSNVVAKDAQIKCLRLGIATSAYSNHIEMLINAKASNPSALAFLNRTGKRKTLSKWSRTLNIRGVPTVSITSTTDNTVSKLSQINLFVDASESGTDWANVVTNFHAQT